MKRRIPSYRLHRPSGQAVVTISGQDFYLGKFDSPESREKFHRLIAEWMTTERTRPASTDARPLPDPTVAEVILAFWRHAQKHYRAPDGTPSEELGNIKAALRPLRLLYEATPARDFGPLALCAVRDEMVRSGLARTSVNSRVNRVRRAFKWAASVELVPVSVVQALATVAGLQQGRTEARETEPIGPVAIDVVEKTLPFLSRPVAGLVPVSVVQALATVAGLQQGRTEARETEPIGPVAIDVVEKTLPFLSRPVAGLVRLQLLTGMRPGEACMIRGRDLLRDEQNWTYKPASHKTAHRGKLRSIPLGPRAVALLEQFLMSDPDAYLFRPADAVAEHHARRSEARRSRPTPSEQAKRKPSPGSKHAARYRRHTYRNAINRACDKAFPHPTMSKIPNRKLTGDQRAELAAWRADHRWHPNQLRHTAATDIRARYGLEAAQVVLGHSQAKVTQVYAERDFEKAREVMREVG